MDDQAKHIHTDIINVNRGRRGGGGGGGWGRSSIPITCVIHNQIRVMPTFPFLFSHDTGVNFNEISVDGLKIDILKLSIERSLVQVQFGRKMCFLVVGRYCVDVILCSKKCRNTSVYAYHKFECGMNGVGLIFEFVFSFCTSISIRCGNLTSNRYHLQWSTQHKMNEKSAHKTTLAREFHRCVCIWKVFSRMSRKTNHCRRGHSCTRAQDDFLLSPNKIFSTQTSSPSSSVYSC